MKRRTSKTLDVEIVESEEQENLDIFHEAARLATGIIDGAIVEYKKETVSVQKKEPKVSVNFKGLEKKMDNEFAQRFNDILATLPDREFVRIYLKTLEFFKPKVVREAGGGGDVKNQTINVVINKK